MNLIVEVTGAKDKDMLDHAREAIGPDRPAHASRGGTGSRVEELASKANEGILTPDERAEYEAYVDAGDIVATLQAVARKTLQAVAG